MKLWVAVVGVLALASRSHSTFTYPDSEDSVLPGVRSMPAGRHPEEERIHFPTDDFTDILDLHEVSASENENEGLPAARTRLSAC